MLLLFFLTAILYSTVGLGGGSTYIALMVLWSVPLTQLPIIALLCNISVVTINLFRYERKDYPLKTLTPLVVTSIPMAYIGGRMVLPTEIFTLLLGSVLLLSGLGMLWVNNQGATKSKRTFSLFEASITGAVLGWIAGAVGIGGGIFLISILHWFRVGNNTRIAQLTSGFIWCNSMAGLLGQYSKHTVEVGSLYGILLGALICVMVGGLIGTQLHTKWLSAKQVTVVSAALICLVGVRLLIQ